MQDTSGIRLNQFILPKGIFFSLPWLLVAALAPIVFILFKAPDTSFANVEDIAHKFVWMFCAFFCARSFGMGWNRIVDRVYDRLNPRTQNRLLCKDPKSLNKAKALTGLFLIGYLFFSALLGKTFLLLALMGSLLIALYSYTKRFSSYCHFVLGAVQAYGVIVAAVCGAMLFTTGEGIYFTDKAIVFTFFWTMASFASFSGADIVYSCSDQSFDKKQGLHSLPVKLGLEDALSIAKTCLAFTPFWATIALMLLISEINNISRYWYWMAALFVFIQAIWLLPMMISQRPEQSFSYESFFLKWQTSVARSCSLSFLLLVFLTLVASI